LNVGHRSVQNLGFEVRLVVERTVLEFGLCGQIFEGRHGLLYCLFSGLRAGAENVLQVIIWTRMSVRIYCVKFGVSLLDALAENLLPACTPELPPTLCGHAAGVNKTSNS